MLTYTNEEQTRTGVVRYLDKVKCQWFNTTKEMKTIAIRTKW